MPSSDGTGLLEARGLWRAYGRRQVLRGLDLAVAAGEAVAVAGPNGAGKTTLLRVLAGLTRPDRGEVRLEGRPLRRDAPEVRRAVGLVSHQTLLYDDLTLHENLTFAAQLYGPPGPRLTRPGLAREPTSHPGGSAAGWPSAPRSRGRSCTVPGSCSWTSRSPRWTRRPASGSRPSWGPGASRGWGSCWSSGQ